MSPYADPEKQREYHRLYRRKQRVKERAAERAAQQAGEGERGSRDEQEEPVSATGHYQLIGAEVMPSGIIKHTLAAGPTEMETLRFARRGVRASLIPARARAPWVFIVGGELLRDKSDAHDRGLIIVMKEWQFDGLSAETVFERIFADATLYQFKGVYADLKDPTLAPFFQAFWEFRSRRNFRHCDLLQAPFCDNMLAQISLIEDWRRRDLLEVDKSLGCYEQMRTVTRQDLIPDGKLPEDRFYLLECLANLVGGFHHDPPRQPPKLPTTRRFPGDRNAWLGF